MPSKNNSKSLLAGQEKGMGVTGITEGALAGIFF
jgi:hypothetical protein